MQPIRCRNLRRDEVLQPLFEMGVDPVDDYSSETRIIGSDLSRFDDSPHDRNIEYDLSCIDVSASLSRERISVEELIPKG